MKVSILIPAYNAALYLHECLNSVIKQTHKDLQIVLIDDGSKDETLKIAKEYAKKDSRIEVYSQQNAGVAITRNHLLNKAKGTYTLFVDADDWIEPEMVETLMTMIADSGAQIAMCALIPQNPNSHTVPSKNNQVNIWEFDEFIKYFLLHRELTGSLCNKLIRTDLYSQFTPGIAYGEDAMVMWKILLSTSKMAVTKNQYYNYRMNPESVSHTGSIMKKRSVVTVWNSIVNTIPNERYRKLAEGRYGAEVTLVLLDGAKNKLKSSDKDIKQLRSVLRNKLISMISSNTLSAKFIIFAIIAAYNWNLAKILSR